MHCQWQSQMPLENFMYVSDAVPMRWHVMGREWTVAMCWHVREWSQVTSCWVCWDRGMSSASKRRKSGEGAAGKAKQQRLHFPVPVSCPCVDKIVKWFLGCSYWGLTCNCWCLALLFQVASTCHTQVRPANQELVHVRFYEEVVPCGGVDKFLRAKFSSEAEQVQLWAVFGCRSKFVFMFVNAKDMWQESLHDFAQWMDLSFPPPADERRVQTFGVPTQA